MKSKVRLGVVGCGVIGREHIKAAARCPDAELVAVADLRVEAAQAAAAEFNIPNVMASGEALAASDAVDALVLAMPTGVRAPVARAALDAGKHVLLEKPPAMNAAELADLAARRNGRVLACASSRFRHFDSARAATAAIAEGAVGNLRLVRFRGVGAARPPRNPPPPWRLNRGLNGGGILVNWGIYDFDYVLGLTGWTLRPRWVLAGAWPVAPDVRDWVAPGSDAETHAVGSVLCDGGVLLHFERGEFLPSTGQNAWEIVGDRGTLHLDMVAQDRGRVTLDTFDPGGVTSRTVWDGPDSGAGVHDGPLFDFVAAIREGRRPATGADEALVMQRLIDAVYRSADTGQPAAVE